MPIFNRYLLFTAFLVFSAEGIAEDVTSNNKHLTIPIARYHDQLMGFWLGQSIANWTGLVTEMDKIGGDGPHGVFYTRDDWGELDQPSIWGLGIPSDLSETITWVLRDESEVWGSDDDTDIEYLYLHLLYQHKSAKLTAEQIRDGWLKHIYSDDNTPFKDSDGKPENFLWVANQQAHDLMRTQKLLPPATGSKEHNPHYDMIDAQLSTEIFGLFAPGRPDVALELAHLPIRTVADESAVYAAEFYVILHSLVSRVDPKSPIWDQLLEQVLIARQHLPNESYLAHMFDDVYSAYISGAPWETVRDQLYMDYQVNQGNGYDISSRNLYCNGCFASGINFGASIISLLYGEADFKKTVKLAVLMGWDSDNPAATWGGLLGFIYGYDSIQKLFDNSLSSQFNIHRTRGNFPNNGLDNFAAMANKGISVTERVVEQQLNGSVDRIKKLWVIPLD